MAVASSCCVMSMCTATHVAQVIMPGKYGDGTAVCGPLCYDMATWLEDAAATAHVRLLNTNVTLPV